MAKKKYLCCVKCFREYGKKISLHDMCKECYNEFIKKKEKREQFDDNNYRIFEG